ncbi:MAG: PQQ-binding-like beta-propeller repeat protein, partial [Planctomycetes bacterium]|nr:PQQ-binding-like beta-propeller repeat protein [Planctomycetota bacterium]
GHLTDFQMQRLLPQEPPEESTPAASSAARTEPAVDELGLAPLEEDEPKTPAPREKIAVKKEPAPSKAEKTRRQPAASPQAVDMVEGELTPLDELDALDEAALDAGNPLMPTAPKKKGLKQLLSLPKSDEPEIKAHEEPKSRDARTRTLIVVVSGLLVSMLIVAGVIWWSLSRTSCDERLLLANESYEKEDYDLAITRYGEFLEFCPKHESASFARVLRALAGLRLKVVGTQDFEAALVAAQETIEKIKDEDEFPRAQEELASLLLDIAEGLANGARGAAKTDPTAAQKLVDLFDEAMELVDNRDYIPNSLRNVKRIDKFVGLVTYVRKDIGENAKLIETLEKIDAALAQGKPNEAYKLLAALLKIYPDLEIDQRVVAKATDIAAAEKDRVRVTPQGARAITEEPSSVVLSSTVLAATRAGKLGQPPGVEGRVVFALAEGAAYGLDASTGAVLWRRFVGFDTQMTPVPIETPDSTDALPVDALLVDSVRNEVVRVVARSGRLRWRHPVGEPFTGAPLLLGNRILVATHSGRLLTLDAESGDALRSADLPQPLHTQPGGPKKGYVYQVGERLNLYVMSLGDGSCRETALLGHDPGSVTVPPLVVQRYVMVVENRGTTFSYLHVFATDVDGLSLKRLQKLRIEGQVNVPLLNLGERGRFMLITDRGRMYVFSTPPGNGKQLREVAIQFVAGESSLVHYPLERKGKLWLASDRLARYNIQFAKERFEPGNQLNPGDTFTQPLAAIGEVLFHARRRKGTPGVVVSAVNLETGGLSRAGLMVDYWQTHLAAPPAAAPHVEANRVIAATAAGDVYEIPLAEAPAVAQPLAVASAPTARAPLVDRIDLPEGRAVFTAGVGGTH